MNALSRLLDERRTVVVVGPGGVGKTTAAAAFALQGARMGKKVLVLTVDPARRLATSLGLDRLGPEEVRIPPALFAEAGVPLGSGALYAMMLDTKTTFDHLIERHAPSPEVRDRILRNRYYQQASTVLAGSQEYMAMEKLYEVREERDYDLVVLDTPPTSHALDFLSAPERLEAFLDTGSLSLLVKGMRAAGRLSFGLLKLQASVLRAMNRFIGAETFVQLLDFIDSFHEMYDGFKARARKVKALFRSPDLAFAIVSAPDEDTLDEGFFLHETLRERGMQFGAFVVNRVRTSPLAPERVAGIEEHLARRGLDPEVAARVASACRDEAALAAVDAERIEDLRRRLGKDGGRLETVPLFSRDVRDLSGLAAFADVVFAPAGPLE